MADLTVKCPKCSVVIPLNDAITEPIEQRLRQAFEQRVKTQEAALAAKAEAIRQAAEALDHQVAERLKSERSKLEQDLSKKAADKVALQLQDLQQQLAEQSKKAQDAQRAELELRKRERALESKAKEMELEVARQLEKERVTLTQEITKTVDESHRLKLAERDKQLEDVKRQLEEARRRADQGSQQLQGEVLEIDLEQTLKREFPIDAIEPVPKGVAGADLVQRVRNSTLQDCGVIVWETKRAKGWKDEWTAKLRDDQRALGAESAILLTTVLPKDVSNFSQRDGVWVTDSPCFLGLAKAVREGLIRYANAKAMLAGKGEKMEAVYEYLTSTAFRQRVEALAETFNTMRADLDQERRVMTKQWAKREKQIERVFTQTAGMYGDLQGIAGASMPELKTMSLEELDTPDPYEEPRPLPAKSHAVRAAEDELPFN